MLIWMHLEGNVIIQRIQGMCDPVISVHVSLSPSCLSLEWVYASLHSHGLDCAQTHTEHSVHGPSIDINSRTCSIQENELLLSCVGEDEDVQRLCSCRSYKKGQVGLCLSCTR